MCLAIPMRVIEIRGSADASAVPQVALVDADGVQREVRLDVVDRRPRVGDYVIVHAGFAIHSLEEGEAECNLRLLRQMAELTTQHTGTFEKT
jgi:hydrogenase expression/formation protein HypC